MTPDQYEKYVANYFQNKGYKVKQTPYSNDYGVDVFAEKNKEKIAIQAKMFGNSNRDADAKLCTLCRLVYAFRYRSLGSPPIQDRCKS